jgi:hypothetical protein
MPSPTSPSTPPPSGKENNIPFQDKGDKKEHPEHPEHPKHPTQLQIRDLDSSILECGSGSGSSTVKDSSVDHHHGTNKNKEGSEKISKKPPRCGKCNKKMVVTFDCTCSLLFCVNHRLPESHDCTDLHVLVSLERQRNKEMLFKLSKDTKTHTLKDRI